MRYTVNGVGLNLVGRGTGPARLFLHYFGGSSRTWEPVIDLLAGSFRCLALDLRGWGDSDAPPAGYHVADMADDVAGLVSTLGLDRYTLMGHSMGGKVAQAFAARHPVGLEALLLIAPSPLSPEPMRDEARAKMRAAWGDGGEARETLTRIAKRPLSEVLKDAVVADNLRASRAAWESWADVGSREDLSDLASQIRIPTRVLVGDADPVVGPDVQAREVVGRIAGATLTVVPEVGHLLPLEDAGMVAGWVLSVSV